MPKGANFIDLTGRIINQIQVLNRNPVNGKRGQVRYDCKCHCGALFTTRGGSLKEGTKSCGCLQRLAARANGKLGCKPGTAKRNLILSYKSRCKKKNLNWDLSGEEAERLFQGNCHYCNQPPSAIYKAKSGNYTYNGIDRINSSLGYTKENCVSCCAVCNYAKNDLTVAEFTIWVQRIWHHWIYKGLYLCLLSKSK